MPHHAHPPLLLPAAPPRAARTPRDLERESFALLVGWQAEKEERAGLAPLGISATEALAGLSAAIEALEIHP